MTSVTFIIKVTAPRCMGILWSCIPSFRVIAGTVKPVWNDHHGGQEKVVLIDRFQTGSVCMESNGRWKFSEIVFTVRWSFQKGSFHSLKMEFSVISRR